MKQLRVRLPEEAHEQLQELVELRDQTKSEITRQAIFEYWQRVTQEPQTFDEIGFVDAERELPDGDTVEQKKFAAIALFRRAKGPAMAAREIGVTQKTIFYWLETDPFFAEMVDWARDETVERVEHALWVDGVYNGVMSARFGFLNARHELYGLMRRDYLERQVRKFIEEVVIPTVEKHLPRTALRALAAELRALPERHFREGT